MLKRMFRLVCILITISVLFQVVINTASSNDLTLNFAGCSQNHWQIPVNTLNEPKIVNDFDANLGKYDPGKRGLDLDVSESQEVKAPESGYILWKGTIANKPTLTFQIGNYKNTFAPVQTDLKVGDTVRVNETIGTIVNYKAPDDEQSSLLLHWGVIFAPDEKTAKERNYIDPKKMIYRKKIVLKR